MLLIDKNGFAFTCKELAIYMRINNKTNCCYVAHQGKGSSAVEL